MQYSVALLLVALLASVSSFSVNSRLSVAKVNSLRARSSRLILAAAEDSEPDFQPEDPKLFDMNRIVRLGRSRDQDGKSNIWSIEPKMVVVDEESEDDGEGGGPGLKNKNLVIGGLVIAAAVAALPLFTFFSKLVPDPSDF